MKQSLLTRLIPGVLRSTPPLSDDKPLFENKEGTEGGLFRWSWARSPNLRGTSCNDYCFVAQIQTKNGALYHFACVADGVGSRERAYMGAHGVCHTVFSQASLFLEDNSITDISSDLFRDWINAFFNSLEQEFEQTSDLSFSRREYATTFLCTIVSTDRSVFYQIGDGAIVYSTKDDPDQFNLFCPPMKGDFANETFTISMSNFSDHALCQHVVKPLVRVCIFSDGIEDAFIDFRDGVAIQTSFLKVFPFLEASVLPTELRCGIVARSLAAEPLKTISFDDKSLIYGTCM